MAARTAVSTTAERVTWLLEHPAFLTGKFDKRKVIQAMKRDGLFASSTWWFDVNLDEAVRQARQRSKT